MNRPQLLSTALIIASLLSGCTQNITSEIKPSLEKKVDFNKTSKIENNITSIEYHDESELDELLLYAKENRATSLNIDTIENTEETIEETSIEDNWVEISKEEELILTAQAFIGAKYVWAANGPECFDCSGFTRYVYREHGITLPRYSGNQAKVGMKIGYDELQIGDLVFFNTEKKYHKKVNHVGIYIGDNKFIHASSAKKQVTITSFKEKTFYKNRFLWGRRVLNDTSTYAAL